MTHLKNSRLMPQVVRVPSMAQLADHRIYQDAADKGLLSVAAPQPRLLSSGFSPTPEAAKSGRRARPVRVAFDPEDRRLREADFMFGGRSALAMAWSGGPFYAWVRTTGGVEVVDRGRTAGAGQQVAQIHGRQPLGIELARAVAAAELVGWGRLAGIAVKAELSVASLAELREIVRIGGSAIWDATLGEALVVALEDLLRRDRLDIMVASGPTSLRGFDEVREIVVMEWAHRLAGSQPLSMPAAVVRELVPDRPLDRSISWQDGDTVPLRVVRSTHYESITAADTEALTLGVGQAFGQQVAALAR